MLPTIGRIVLYTNAGSEVPVAPKSEVSAAIVTGIYGNSTAVDLTVFYRKGAYTHLEKVECCDDADAGTDDATGKWSWPVRAAAGETPAAEGKRRRAAHEAK